MSAVSEVRSTVLTAQREVTSLPPLRVAADIPNASVAEPLQPGPSTRTCLEFLAVDLEIVFDPVATVVSVSGEIDAWTAPMLTAVLETLTGGNRVKMTLDLAGCRFMDAAGLTTIVETSISLDASGGTLIIRDASPSILRIFDLTGVDQRVQLESSTGERR